jgi:hypothetical protein
VIFSFVSGRVYQFDHFQPRFSLQLDSRTRTNALRNFRRSIALRVVGEPGPLYLTVQFLTQLVRRRSVSTKLASRIEPQVQDQSLFSTEFRGC